MQWRYFCVNILKNNYLKEDVKMNCPYCDNKMEEGVIISQKVPEWKSENNKFLLSSKKTLTTNEIKALSKV